MTQRLLGCRTGQIAQGGRFFSWGSCLVSIDKVLAQVAPVRCRGEAKVEFFEAALRCRCTPCLQASLLAAGSMHPQNLLCPAKLRGSRPNVLAVWEKGGQWMEDVPRPFHRLLFWSWCSSQNSAGGRGARVMQGRLPYGDVHNAEHVH